MATKASSKFFRFFELSYSARRSAADAKKVIKPKWYEKVFSGLEPPEKSTDISTQIHSNDVILKPEKCVSMKIPLQQKVKWWQAEY